METFKSGATRYTDAERKRDEEDRKHADQLQANRRRARSSRQNYNKPGTTQHRRLYARMVGSE